MHSTGREAFAVKRIEVSGEYWKGRDSYISMLIRTLKSRP